MYGIDSKAPKTASYMHGISSRVHGQHCQHSTMYAFMGANVSISRPSSQARSWTNLLSNRLDGTCGLEWDERERHSFQWRLSSRNFCFFCGQIHRAPNLGNSALQNVNNQCQLQVLGVLTWKISRSNRRQPWSLVNKDKNRIRTIPTIACDLAENNASCHLWEIVMITKV